MFNVQTYKTPPDRWFVRESRPYDFLYDSTYTQPSREDFIKSAQHGMHASGKLALLPIYNTMFSGLKNVSRIKGCRKELQPSVFENFMPEYDINGVPIIPADTGPLPLPRLIDEVTGANRAKYALRYTSPCYKMDTQATGPTAFDDGKKFKAVKGKYVSKSMQTDYRESESQTDPYSPPYFLPYPGAYPKLLALVKLTWEKGLPFSLDDIVIIERALSKRQLEKAGKEIESEKDFEKRIKLMEELEAQQWADREKELDKLRHRKMELTSRLLNEYSSRVTNDHTLRLERLHAKLKKQTKVKYDTIKHEYFRDLRKLEGKYLRKPESRGRDIIKDYTRFDSRIYAPLARIGDGIGNGKRPSQFYWNFHDFDTIDAITKDEAFCQNELSFNVDKFKKKIEKCRPTGTEKRLEKKLENIYLSFKDHSLGGQNHMNLLEDLDNTGPPGLRPTTPEITIEGDPDVECRKPHVVLLQKIARGRVIQKLIRGEIERNMSEILGLKLMYDMDPNCLRVEESRLQKLMAMKKNTDSESSQDTSVAEVVGHLEGETLARAIDFLDKEMVRLIDERKIHALILLAERERKRKEAEEGGRRYKEENSRRAHDEVFKHVTGIHQATVDLYLEDIFLESCDRVADDQSRIYVQRMANSLNDALYSNQNPITDFEQDELAADLVSSFMIPELHRIYHKSRVEAAGGRYRKASRQVVEAIFSSHPVTKDVISQLQPVVDEHILSGAAAIDGGAQALDEIIGLAVLQALLPLHTTLVPTEDTSAATEVIGEEGSKSDSKSKEDSQSSSIEKDKSRVSWGEEDVAQQRKDSKDSRRSKDGKVADSNVMDTPDVMDREEGDIEEQIDIVMEDEDETIEHPLEEEEETSVVPADESVDIEKKKASVAPGDLELETAEMSLEGEEQSEGGEEEERKEEEAEEAAEDSEVEMETMADSQLLEDGDAEDEAEEEAITKVEEPKVVYKAPPKIEFHIEDDVYRSLAAKSVQVAMDTELGQQVEAVFTGAEVTVDDLFEEVTENITPKIVEDSASDATLSEDSDA